VIATSSLFAWEGGVLSRARVTQCALSRICGACGESLGRPIAFVGTERESDRNEFHGPPLHASCAGDVLALDDSWRVVQTAAFEFVRPGRDDLDQQVRFELVSRLGG
jgi:hypothetical protein